MLMGISLLLLQPKIEIFLEVFKVLSWHLHAHAIPGSVVEEVDPLTIFIPTAFGKLPFDFFACHK